MKQLHPYMLLFALVLLMPSASEANTDHVGDCNRCYECSENPINPCAFDIQVQAGIVPTSWRHRGFVYGNNCDILPSAVSEFFPVPHFNTLYKLPWIIGGQIGYGLDCNTRLFVEFNYAQSRSRCPVVPTFSRTLGLAVSRYKFYDGYVGVRYYTDRICNRTSFFVGAKVGFIHHKAVTFGATIISTTPFTVLVPESSATLLYAKNTVISGGGHIGADICLWGPLSLVITGEVVASCGPRGNALIAIAPAVLGVNSLLVDGVANELRFPITVGVRYSF